MKEDRLLAIKIYPSSPPNILDWHEVKADYITLCTPQALDYLQKYLKTRYKSLAAIPPNDYLITHDKFPQCQTSDDSIRKGLTEIAQKAGIRAEGHDSRNRASVPLIHGFRKFYNITLVNTGVDKLYKEKLMGHGLSIEGHYFQPTERELLNEYRKAIPALTFDIASLIRAA